LEQKKSSEKSEIDFARITKVTNEAIAQFKTIKRVINNKWLDRYHQRQPAFANC
jgi:hypothetical protein